MTTESNSADPLDTLKCPITYEFFRDPVIGDDGHTYERKNITAWIQKNATSPITREPMSLAALRPNYLVKKMVEEFVSLSLQKEYQFRLDVDVCKAKQRPLFQGPGKTIYEAKWLLKHGPSIVLIEIDGAKAKFEASFYVKLSCHPHIVRTYGLVNSNSSESIMLLQEYAPEGDLRKLLRDNHFQPTIEVLIEILWQITNAMICLTDNQIIHGDLACRNVLVFRSSSTQPTDILVKLTDFGLTRVSTLFSVIESPRSSTLPKIPIRYAAPELLFDSSSALYSEKSDVYSFGVLMWEICSLGAVPYGELRATETVYQERLKGRSLERPSKCSTELWNIIVNCMQSEPNERPTFKDIQETILSLRFENRRMSAHQTSTTSESPGKTSSPSSSIQTTTRQQYYNQKNSSEVDSHHVQPSDTAFYKNLYNHTNEQAFSSTINAKASLCQYYIICDYCLQSINTDDFDTHASVCKVRRVIKVLVEFSLRLSPLQIVSCQYCENMIPLNMFKVHRSYCNANLTSLTNVFQKTEQYTLTDSYVTLTYLSPISLPKLQTEDKIYDYATLPEEKSKESAAKFSIQSDPSSQQSITHAIANVKPLKPPKSGIHRVFSSLKKKFAS